MQRTRRAGGRRLAAAFAAFAALAAAGAAAAGEGLGRESCAVTREILSAAIAARQKGETSQAIKARLAAAGGAVPEKYRATVAPLVDLVFSVDRSALGEPLAAQYEEQCLKYER